MLSPYSERYLERFEYEGSPEGGQDIPLRHNPDRFPPCHGSQGSFDVSPGSAPVGLVHSGPRPDAAGVDIIANGPALCSPLNGVGFVTSKPQGAASSGLLNQKPTWNVFVGGTLVVPSAFLSASKPK